LTTMKNRLLRVAAELNTKMFQRCWSAMLSGCSRVRVTFNAIE
jgi:hypothetical protein